MNYDKFRIILFIFDFLQITMACLSTGKNDKDWMEVKRTNIIDNLKVISSQAVAWWSQKSTAMTAIALLDPFSLLVIFALLAVQSFARVPILFCSQQLLVQQVHRITGLPYLVIIAGNETCLFWIFSIKNKKLKETDQNQLNNLHVIFNKKKKHKLSIS